MEITLQETVYLLAEYKNIINAKKALENFKQSIYTEHISQPFILKKGNEELPIVHANKLMHDVLNNYEQLLNERILEIKETLEADNA